MARPISIRLINDENKLEQFIDCKWQLYKLCNTRSQLIAAINEVKNDEKYSYIGVSPLTATISDQTNTNKQNKQIDDEIRLDEIEEILLDLPFNDPEFEKLVNERNNLLIKIQK